MAIFLLVLCAFSIIILKHILKISFKKAKELEENEKLKKISDKFPSNNKIAKEMLEILDNSNVTIEESKDTKTSLYMVINNKIILSDLKDNYGRIGTIAHECMHSVQDRTLLIFNFIYSNFVIFYWIFSMVLILFNVFTNILLQLFILLFISFIHVIIRVYLETDAMIKSKELSIKYIDKQKICTENEKQELIKQYEIINDMGILFYIFSLISSAFLKIALTIVISFINI